MCIHQQIYTKINYNNKRVGKVLLKLIKNIEKNTNSRFHKDIDKISLIKLDGFGTINMNFETVDNMIEIFERKLESDASFSLVIDIIERFSEVSSNKSNISTQLDILHEFVEITITGVFKE